MKYEKLTNSAIKTKEFATRLGTLVSPGDVITLEGDLGAGKTTFTQGLAVGLGVKRNVTSPTFTIIKEYQGRIPLYHMDVYRLEDAEEDIGFAEYFYGTGITIIEWAQYIDDFLPKNRLDIYIEVIDQDRRKIICQSSDSHYETLISELKAAEGDK